MSPLFRQASRPTAGRGTKSDQKARLTENERALFRVVETLALADGNDGRLSLAAVENAARAGEMLGEPGERPAKAAQAFV